MFSILVLEWLSQQGQQTGWSSYFFCSLPGNRQANCWGETEKGAGKQVGPSMGVARRRENSNRHGSSAASKDLRRYIAPRRGGKPFRIQAPQHDCESRTHGPTDSQHCCRTSETPWEAAQVSGDISVKGVPFVPGGCLEPQWEAIPELPPELKIPFFF